MVMHGFRNLSFIRSGAGPLYSFASFTFTNGTQEGRFGPSLANLLASYDTVTNSWLNNTSYFNSVDGIQTWAVPADGTYRITARGGQGGNASGLAGGLGAIIRGDFVLTKGTLVRLLVGQRAIQGGTTSNKGGGGGSFVWISTSSTPLLIAGGGGGSQASASGVNASTGTSGTLKSDGTGTAGINGNGTTNGAGWFSNGITDGTAANGGVAPLRPLEGGTGGSGYSASHEGGFGGGGGGGGSPSTTQAAGGGGGYSGGAGVGTPATAGGGGGGSINLGTTQSNTVGNSGHGSILISKIA
jgi:hypothetical protein